MASTYSTSLKLTLIGDGDQTGTWGQTTNANFGTLLEQAIVGQTTITMANADYTLTNLNGATDEARSAVLIVTGNQNATYSVIVPAVPKLYMVTNSLSSSAIAYIKPSGGSTTQVPNGRTMYLYCTGSAFVALDYVQFAQSLVTGGSITTGAINCTSLTSSGAISGTTGGFSGAVSGTTGTFSGAVSGTTLTSTIAIGTAPFTVTSTTPVTNLSIGGNAATATLATLATTATNLAGGAANRVPYQSGAGTTTFVTAPTVAGTALTWSGSALAWTTPSVTYANGCVYENGQTITSNYTMTASSNGMSAGPITIDTAATVTIPTGSNWVIV